MLEKMADSSFAKKMNDTYPNGSFTKHVIFFIRESLRRCHNNTVSSVDSKRIEVLHITNCDAIVVNIPHDFIFDFLPSQHTLLDKNLRTDS